MRLSSAAILCLSASLLLGGCNVWSAPKHYQWNNATGGEQFERLLWQSIQKKDWLTLQKHLAPTFVMSTSEGTLDRDAALADFQKWDVRDFSLGDVQVHPAGDALVVTYTITLQGAKDGRALSGEPMRMMTVWQQSTQGWMAIAHSQAPIAAAPMLVEPAPR